MAVKVLLDTDIGNDIDDAVALAYLLAQPQCELMGITTVTGRSDLRARMCSAICQAVGVDVPIYPGIEAPLLARQRQGEPPQAVALKRWTHRTDFPRGQAIEFLRRTIRENPGEVVLLTIGPLTNAAVLFAMDPELPGLLKSLVMMCGVFGRGLPHLPPAEWNALNDPHATAIVYRAAAPVHRSIGLDVTMQVRMDADEVRRRFAAIPRLAPVLDFAEVFFRTQRTLTFHDPLAAATIFDDAVCTFTRGNVEVELAGERFAGATPFAADPAGRHEVALAVDPQGFFDHFFGVF